MTKEQAEWLAEDYDGTVSKLINNEWAVEMSFESFEKFVKSGDRSEYRMTLAHGRMQVR